MSDISKITIQNQEYDLRDNYAYSIIATPYSSQSTYEADDYCTYNYKLYKCVTPVSIAEEFDVHKWKQTQLFNDVELLGFMTSENDIFLDNNNNTFLVYSSKNY